MPQPDQLRLHTQPPSAPGDATLELRRASFERAFRDLNRRGGRLPIIDAGPQLPELKKSARRMIEDALSKLSEVEPAGLADAMLGSEPPFFLRLAGSWDEDAA